MNNMAEYEACILGLKMTIDMNVQEFLVTGHSEFDDSSSSRRMGCEDHKDHTVL